MERPNVPKFGNWDEEEEVPYTIYFDKARKGRGGKKMINPNDPEENPDLFADNNSIDRSRSRKGSIHESSSHQRRGSNSSNRPTRQSIGSDRSFDQSPLHPLSRGKATGGVGAGNSPGRDINKSPHHNNQGNRTPGVTRMKPNSKDHGITPEKGGAVIPPFGQWDEKDPDCAENYTEIFNINGKGSKTGFSTAPIANSDPSNYKIPKQKAVDQGCCFSCFKI